MSISYYGKGRKLLLALIIIAILIAAGWFGMKVMSVDGEMSLDERIAKAFGWGTSEVAKEQDNEKPFQIKGGTEDSTKTDFAMITEAATENCTARYGYLMLINPQFKVEESFVAARQNELIDVGATYGIRGINALNNGGLLDAEAAKHLDEMATAYSTEYPGHELRTTSCFTTTEVDCGQKCAEVGESDYQTGLACGLVDVSYGTELMNEVDGQHPEWQWLRENSYRYGFVERYSETQLDESAMGQEGSVTAQDGTTTEPASEPTGANAGNQAEFSRRWHYRYVGIEPATEIATGKYNDGKYDSLENYLQARGLIVDLSSGTCE
ncbi:D-alanyl-D-alanine carboxypeptidase family protein [Candidatus Saccharibacteria bacterium]|nr:D-alanyl-D-alanine carboxypeptidase family protein [Candidatus Saccharibacteria bacterium]